MARKTPAKRKSPPTAYIVAGYGTDAEIAARCAESVEGWADIGERAQADMIRLMRQWWEQKPAPRMEVEGDDTGSVIRPPEGSNVTLNALRLGEALGCPSPEYMDDRLLDLSSIPRASSKGGMSATSASLSAGIAFVAGGNPTDTVQSTLLVQMAATHEGAMRAIGAAARTQYVDQVKVFGNLATKFLNAYTRQAEVLAKLQRGGEQVVKHVHIDNRGGQAVVTEQVVTGGRGSKEDGEQAYGQHQEGALSPALLGSDAFGQVVPMPSREGQEAVPIARRREGQRGASGE